MPIEVELPDGSIAEFPDGTPNDVIKGALQRRFAPPESQASQALRSDLSGITQSMRGQPQGPSTVKDVLASGASGIARGAADLAGLPGTVSDLLKSGGDFLLSRGYQAVTGDAPEPGSFFAGMSGIPQDQREQLGVESQMSGPRARAGLSSLTGGAT